ncbi:SDR family oxidoreductase [Caballeronia sp. GAFFF2]|uniref:SDR family NAD(P)-dependent oxidoreductase n=1 Tax=Caballeronia sp. GAFFF2 TaxID=2921741 RepID=UPI0020280F73|nr:SDR family oxidoreductase [Caballeronia sp. GAFFF2]
MKFARYPSLEGRHVLVTGGGGGIGASHVEQFYLQGARVAFIERDAAAAHALLDKLDQQGLHKPVFLQVDLRDVGAVKTTIEQHIASHGDIDVLVNNAAHDERHTLESVSVEYWDERIALNLRHLFFCAQAVVPGMIRRGEGSIINVGSFSWHVGLGGMPIYTAAKAGIEGLTRGLARDLGQHNVRVNTLIPGWIMTQRQIDLWVDEKGKAEIARRQCLKDLVMPDDVARMALWLASDDSRMCSAQNFVVDGGWS